MYTANPHLTWTVHHWPAESQNKAAEAATANRKDEQPHRNCLRLLRSQQRDRLWLLASAEDVSSFRSGPAAAVPKRRRFGKHHHTQEGGRDSITTHERTAAPPQRRRGKEHRKTEGWERSAAQKGGRTTTSLYSTSLHCTPLQFAAIWQHLFRCFSLKRRGAASPPKGGGGGQHHPKEAEAKQHHPKRRREKGPSPKQRGERQHQREEGTTVQKEQEAKQPVTATPGNAARPTRKRRDDHFSLLCSTPLYSCLLCFTSFYLTFMYF